MATKKPKQNNGPGLSTSARFAFLNQSAESLQEARDRLRRKEMEGHSTRGERFEEARAWAAVSIMYLIVIALGIAVGVMLIASFTNILIDTPAIIALRELFVQLVTSAKSIVLILVGFFFRDYYKKVI